MNELEGTTATVPDEGSLDQQPQEQNPWETKTDTRSLGEQISQGQQPQPQAAPAAPVAAPQQAQVPQWDGSQFSLKYRDQSIIPKSREELISLAQKGFSYSQEMEQLNKQKATLAQYEQLDALLKSNPAMAQRFIEVINEQAAQAAQPPEESQQQAYVPPELLQRINYLEQHHQTLIEKDQDDKLNREIEDLKVKYPDGGWEAVPGQESMETRLLRFALDNNMSNLDYAYRVMNWDNVRTNSKAEGLKAAKEARQAQHQAGVVTTGQRAPVAPSAGKTYSPNDNYNDLARKMAEEMR